MKIKVLRGELSGTEQVARMIKAHLLDIKPRFQIIEGKDSGKILKFEDCVVVDEEKTFTEQEWKCMVKTFTNQIESRDKEISSWKEQANRFEMQLNEVQLELDELKTERLVKAVDIKIFEWEERGYEGDAAEDRMEFAKELTSFVKQELVNQ